nr:MAG TPA: hypothetical protein [Caudoviricetes sp.]
MKVPCRGRVYRRCTYGDYLMMATAAIVKR